MNGDFLSLLPPNAFARAAAASEHGPAALEGTTVFAFQFADGALVAGDHRATAGNVVFSDRTEKIVEIDAHSLMAIAGSPAMAFEMARTLQTTFEFYRRSQLQPMSLAAKLRAVSRLLRENMPATLQGVGMVAPIFVGLDVPAGRPLIHFYDPLGAQFEAASFAASGSGSGSIRSVLYFLQKWGLPRPQEMPLAQAVALALRLLTTAAEFDTATGGVNPEKESFATIRLLTSEGVRAIDDAEQARFWRDGEKAGR
jgi:proteasome beta subunit